MSDEWAKQVAADVTRALPTATAKEALHRFTTDYGVSIKIETPRYQDWLHKNDPHRKKTIGASVAEFLQRRKEYHAIVADLLDGIGLYEIGTALYDELDRTPNIVSIKPYGLYKDDVNATASANKYDSTADKMPIMRDGRPTGEYGNGKGANSVVRFSPNQFDPDGKNGPASRPDEVLFHELVHSSRQMRGVAFRLPVNQGYDNEEEYISVVLANIYLSQKRQMTFRASHHGFHSLKDPEKYLDNLQGVNPPVMVLIERFRHSSKRFYDDVAKIPDQSVWFNPIRTYERQRRAAMAWHH